MRNDSVRCRGVANHSHDCILKLARIRCWRVYLDPHCPLATRFGEPGATRPTHRQLKVRRSGCRAVPATPRRSACAGQGFQGGPVVTLSRARYRRQHFSTLSTLNSMASPSGRRDPRRLHLSRRTWKSSSSCACTSIFLGFRSCTAIITIQILHRGTCLESPAAPCGLAPAPPLPSS